MYSKIEFGKELKKRVLLKHHYIDIGKWVYEVYLECSEKEDKKFLEFLIHLSTLELGYDFERSHDELMKIADDLIAGKEVKL